MKMGSFSACYRALFIACLLLILPEAVAQPANDACANAIELIPGTGLCEPAVYTNAAATATGDPSMPSCWSTGYSASVWFRFVAGSTAARINTNFNQTLINTKVAVYSGSCGSLVLAGCQNDVYATDNQRKNSLIVRNLTPGNTYYIAVDSDGGTGAFAICVENVTTTTPCTTLPGQDCNNAFYVTSTSPLSIPAGVNGIGSSMEPSPCILSEENSVWLKFYAATSGKLAFTVTPSSAVNIDFSVYDVTDGCQGAPMAQPAGCSSNSSTAGGGTVGWNCPSSLCGTSSCTGTALNCPTGLDVTAGRTYGVMVERKSNAQALTVSFNGIINQPGFTIAMPRPRFVASSECLGNPVNFTNFNRACHFSYNWDFGDGGTSYDINPSHSYANPGTYDVKLTLTDLNTGNTSVASQSVVIAPGPQAIAGPKQAAQAQDTIVCAGQPVQLRGTASAFDISSTGQITFNNFAGGSIGSGFTSFPLTTTQISPGILAGNSIVRVCLDVATTRCSDLIVLLESPTGQRDTIINAKGFPSHYFTDVCVEPNGAAWASGVLDAAYTGTYRVDNASGTLGNLTGSDANGIWKLLIKDLNTLSPASLLGWSMTLNTLAADNEIVDITWEAEDGTGVNFAPPVLNSAAGTGTTTASGVPFVTTNYLMRAVDLLGCATVDTVRVLVAQADITVTTGNVTIPGGCDGTAAATADGPFPPFTFTWRRANGTLVTAPNITGLCSGTYKVYSQDARGCRDSTLFTIYEPGVGSLLLNTNFTDPKCNGDANGTISISPGAGLPPLVYTWTGPIALSSGVNQNNKANLPAGQYKCVVRDNNGTGIKDSVIIDLFNPLPLQIFATGNTPVSCFGGSNGMASVDASGGILGPNSDYKFFWKRVSNNGPIAQFSRTATGLIATTYRCIVTDDNNCQDSIDVTIAQPAAAVDVTLVSSTPVSCAGGSNGAATVAASGGNGSYTYLWVPGNEATPGVTGKAAGQYKVYVRDSKGCEDSLTVNITAPSPLSLSVSARQNVRCFGAADGNATISATGGAGSYTYRFVALPVGNTLQNSAASQITNLGPGDYKCVVTDGNGCKDSTSFTILQPLLLAMTYTQLNPDVAGGSNGSITLTVQDGTTPYTYSWKTGSGTPLAGTQATLSGLAAGTYRGIVTDANGCKDSVTVLLTEPGVLTVTATVNNVRCPGQSNGEADANATGGTGPYTFSWAKIPAPLPGTFGTTGTGPASERATGLVQGTYTVTVTDNAGATASQTFSVAENNGLSPIVAKSDVNCFGADDGTASVDPNGGTAPYRYNWTGPSAFSSTLQTIELLAPGNYTITVTDTFGCTGTTNITITQPAAPLTLNSLTGTNLTCHDVHTGAVSVNVTGGTPNTVGPAYNYVWQRSGSPLVYTTATVTNLPADQYTLTVSDANGCFVTGNITLTEPTALSLTPTTTAVTCEDGSDGTIDLTVAGGTGPYTYRWEDGPTTQDRTGLPKGNYKVVVRDAAGCKDSMYIDVPENPGIVVNLQQTNISCNGGSNGELIVRASGGVRRPGLSPYFYSINPAVGTQVQDSIFRNLPTGTYTITVTDNISCTNTLQAVVTMPQVITLQTSQTSAAAPAGTNGTATVNIQGGTPPYAIDWSNDGTGDNDDPATITGLAQGSYSVTVTDANGCTRNANVTVTQSAGGAIVANAVVINASCDSQSNGTASINVTGGQPPYTYTWTPNVSSTSFATNLVPNVNYQVRVDDSGPAAFTTVNFTVTDPPALTLNVANTNLACYADKGTLTANVTGGTPPYRYHWVSSQIVGSFSTQTISDLTAGTYIVTVTDNNNCNISTTARVISPQELKLSISFVNDNDCFDDNSGSAIVTPTGGTQFNAPAQPYNYTWLPGSYTTATVNNLKAGTYKVIVRDRNACLDSALVTVEQPDEIEIDVSVTNVACGGGQTGAAGLTVNGGTPPYTYRWKNISDPSFEVLGTDQAQNLPAGIYRTIVTDNNQCADSVNFQIFQPKALVLQATRKPVSCNNGNDGGLFALATGGLPGTTGYVYTWKDPASGAQLGTGPSLNGLMPGNYRAIVTDERGCQDSLLLTLTNPTPIQLARQLTNPLCRGGSNGFLRVLPSGGSGGFSYLWLDNNSTAQTRTGVAAGTYTVQVTDAAGCLATTTFTLTDPPAMTWDAVQVTPSSGLANGSITVLDITRQQDPSTLVLKGVTDPGFTPQTVGPASEPYPAFTALPAGTYRVVLTDANGCMDSTDVVVSQSQLRIENLVDESCLRNDGSATVNTSSSPATGTITYTWYRLPTRSQLRTVTQNQPTDVLGGLSSGTYRVVVSDQSGYLDSVEFLIQPGQVLILRPDYAECLSPGDPVSTNVDLNNPAPMLGSSPATGTWAAFDQMGNPVSNLSGTTFQANAQGLFYCVFTESNSGCQDTVRLFFGALDAGNDTLVCVSGSSTFTVAPPYGVGTWTASDPNVLVLDAQRGIFSLQNLTPPTTFDLTLTAVGGGCSDDLTVMVERGPTAAFTANPALPQTVLFMPLADVLLTNTSQLNGATGVTCLWDMGDGTVYNTCNGQVAHRYQRVGNYNICLTLQSDNCDHTFCVNNIVVAEDAYVVIPGVLTPNGDGQNDVLRITTNNIARFELIIFDRYGVRVHQSTNPSEQWNGTKNGNDLPSGTYFWVVKAVGENGIEVNEAGNITILR